MDDWKHEEKLGCKEECFGRRLL